MSSASTTGGSEIPSRAAAESGDSTQQQGTSRPVRDLTERLELSAKEEFATIQDERAALVGMLAHLIANVERSGNRITFALAVLSFCLFGAGAFIWMNMMQASGLRYGEPRQILATVVPDRFPRAAPGTAEAAARPSESPVAPAPVDPEPVVPANAPAAPPPAEPSEGIAAATPPTPPPVSPPMPPPAAEPARAPDRPQPVQAPAISEGDRIRDTSVEAPRALPPRPFRRTPIAGPAPARREVRNTGSIRRPAPLAVAYRHPEPAYGRVLVRAAPTARRRSARPVVTTAYHGGGIVELRPRVVVVKAAPRRAARRLVVARQLW